MDITKVIDVITPEHYTEYTNTKAEENSQFIQSGVIVKDTTLDEQIINGGKLLNMPEWQKTNLTDQVLADDRALKPSKTSAKKQIAHVLYRGTASGYSDLSAILAGSNPVTQLLNDFSESTLMFDQVILMSIVQALFNDGEGEEKGALLDSHVHDATHEESINTNMVLDARSILGTSRRKITAIAMHSKVKTELQKQNANTQNYIPASESRVNFDTYLGMRVIEDDALLPDENGIYDTYLFGEGAFGLNTATPSSLVTFETDREASKGNNLLYTRRSRVIHPYGLQFTSDTVSDETPTNSDLRNPANWKKVREDKKVGLLCLRHKLPSQTTGL